MNIARVRRRVLLLFALSGASALIYQIIWTRQLGLVFGNTTPSISIVLSTFMAGLALGAHLSRKWIHGDRNPLRLYAVLELAIGAYALILGPLIGVLENLYPSMFADDTSPGLLTAVRIGASALLLIPPTLMMGATLPLTTEFVRRLEAEHGAWHSGRLYAANTLGAALGALASGYFIIELVGVTMTVVIAAAFNAFVGFIGWRLSKSIPTSAPEAPSGPAPFHPILALFAVTGALALAGEVLWSRVLTMLLGNSTYSLTAILVAYLVGIALGSWLMAALVPRLKRPEAWVPFLVVFAGLWHVLAVELFPALQAYAGSLFPAETRSKPEVGAMGVLLVVSMVVSLMMPPAILSGALFPAVTRIAGGRGGDRGDPIARAYTWNTVGSIFGAFLAGFVIAPVFFQFHAIQLLAVGFAAAAVLAVFALGLKSSKAVFAGVMILAVGVAAYGGYNLVREDLFVRNTKARGNAIPFHQADLAGVTSVVMPVGQPHFARVLVNGHGMTHKVFVTKAMAHMPLIAAKNSDDTLVICFGMGTTFRSSLAWGGAVDVVELVPGVFETFDLHYDDAEKHRTNPKARMIVNDGRNFLLMTEKKYDVITIDPPPPINASGVTNLYSREFVELMKSHLKEGGIAAHWIPSADYWSGVPDDDTIHLLLRTFFDVFPYVKVYEGRVLNIPFGLHVLGSMEPIDLTEERIREAMKERPAVAADLTEIAWDAFAPDRLLHASPITPETIPDGPLLTDDHPTLEFNLLRMIRADLAAVLVHPAF